MKFLIIFLSILFSYHLFAEDIKDCNCTDGFVEYCKYDETKNFIGFCSNEKGRQIGKTFYEDGTSFEKVDVEEVGEDLKAHGFEPTGSEMLCNGMTGEMMSSSVFIGPVYYQRLKHIVSDKIHSRATGAVQSLTRQPLDGRSRGGGYVNYFFLLLSFFFSPSSCTLPQVALWWCVKISSLMIPFS